MKYTAPVRRGFLTLLRYLEEDTPHTVDDATHPMYRRLKNPAKANLKQAIEWLRQEGLDQHKWDDAKAKLLASPPTSDGNRGVPDRDDEVREGSDRPVEFQEDQ